METLPMKKESFEPIAARFDPLAAGAGSPVPDAAPPPGGEPRTRSRQLIKWTIGGIILASALLCLARLDEPSMWDDEAFTAQIARNLLRFGHFTLWDGRNLLTSNNGATNFRVHLPGFDALLTAISFRLFGYSNAAARLPSALFSIATLSLYALFLYCTFPEQKKFVLYATLLLGLSVQFLLIGRNCRYYAIALFCTMLTYVCYNWALRTRKIWAAVCLGGAAALLFYAHPLSAACLLVSLATVHFTFNARGLGLQGHKVLILSGVIFFSVAVPYTLYDHIAEFSIEQPHASPLIHKAILVLWNLRDLNLMYALPWMLIPGWVWFGFSARRDNRSVALWQICRKWLLLVVLYSIVCGLVSPQLVVLTTIADLRYLFPVLPFSAGAVACLLVWIDGYIRGAALAVLLVILSSNILAWTPLPQTFPFSSRVRWLLPAYLTEITNPYPTATQSVSELLRANSNEDDVVATFPNYFGYPLIYYVGDRLKICCLLQHDTAIPMKTLRPLKAPLFIEDTFPDWLIFYGGSPFTRQLLNYFGRPHQVGPLTVRRWYSLEAVLPCYPVQTQRPELPWHEFVPPKADPVSGSGVYIFRATSGKRLSHKSILDRTGSDWTNELVPQN